jgi:hypothetical protein
MSYNKLIHDYLDGELGQTQQDMLFAELAHNADARHEFNQQMKLHRIAQNDMSVIAPPVATTNAIFSQLGFSIPPAGFAGGNASTAAGAGIGAVLMMFFRKYSGNILTAISGALLTGLIFFYLANFEPDRIPVNNNQAVRTVQTPPVISSIEGSAPVMQSPMVVGNNFSADDVERMINSAMNNYMSKIDDYYKQYYAASNQQLKDNENKIADVPIKTVNNDVSEYKPNNFIQKTEPQLLPPTIKQDNTVPVNNQPLLMPANSSSLFNFSARAYSANSSVAVDVPSKSNPWFSNMGVSLSYNLSQKHSLGIEVGQEAFPQSFTRTQYEEILAQEQNPMLAWFGATYKYSMMNWFIPDILFPYVQVLGGVTKVGPLGRAQIGIQYRPDKRVSFSLGAEGSVLWYNVQGKVYDTKKLGLTYGVSIHY